METLVDEILIKIVEQLKVKDRIRCERVSKRWKEIVRSTWKRFKFTFANDAIGSVYDHAMVSTSHDKYHNANVFCATAVKLKER